MAEEDENHNRCKGEKKDNLGDLLIAGTVQNFQDLEANMENCALELFNICKWSISPLMVACLLGYKDIVKFLLGKGANPNEKCTDEMNTPLHYACMLREYFARNYLPLHCDVDRKKYTDTPKEEIIKLLCDQGAVFERNALGFLPIHYAALFAMENIVDYLINTEPITGADRLMAMEVLGVSQSVVLRDHSKAYFSFITALLIRHDIRCELPPFPSELGQHFKCKECTTFDELHKLKDDEYAMFIQGLLVGERVLPEKLKPKCLWSSMLDPTRDLPDPTYETEEYLCACQYCLKLEMNSRLAVGTVLEGFKDLLCAYTNDNIKKSKAELIQMASCLADYKEILTVVDSKDIADRSSEISFAFGSILGELMWRFPNNRQPFDLLYKIIIGLVEIYCEQTFAYKNTHSVESVPYFVLQDVREGCQDLDRKERRTLIVLLNHVLPVLLKYFPRVHKIDVGEETMLHVAVSLLLHVDEQDFDVICAITRKLVRHGCPIEAKNSAGKTAKDFALSYAQNFEIDHPEFDEILALLSKPSEVLSLQELSARCVLRSRIPYSLGTVPVTVYDFLNGEDFMQNDVMKD